MICKLVSIFIFSISIQVDPLMAKEPMGEKLLPTLCSGPSCYTLAQVEGAAPGAPDAFELQESEIDKEVSEVDELMEESGTETAEEVADIDEAEDYDELMETDIVEKKQSAIDKKKWWQFWK